MKKWLKLFLGCVNIITLIAANTLILMHTTGIATLAWLLADAAVYIGLSVVLGLIKTK